MAETNYVAPVDKLLKIGEVSFDKNEVWQDYPGQYGLGPEDVPELIRMASDPELWFELEASDPAMYAGIHAWRALGQLKAESAIDPLIALFDQDDDHLGNDMPEVFAMIGPTAIPALANLIKNNSQDYSHPALIAVDCLEQIAKDNPASREQVIETLTGQLELYQTNAPALNGFLIASLANLKATKTASLIESVYKEGKLDDIIISWNTVQYEFGLMSKEDHDRLEEEARQARRAELAASGSGRVAGGGSKITPSSKIQKAKAKAKRKIEKASRKKNQKHK